jgi:hypothetical protein
MIRLKHEIRGIRGHLLHSSFQSLTISPTLTSCVLPYLSLPYLIDMMNFLQGILNLEFSEYTCCSIFGKNMQEGHSEYKRHMPGPESQGKFSWK